MLQQREKLPASRVIRDLLPNLHAEHQPWTGIHNSSPLKATVVQPGPHKYVESWQFSLFWWYWAIILHTFGIQEGVDWIEVKVRGSSFASDAHIMKGLGYSGTLRATCISTVHVSARGCTALYIYVYMYAYMYTCRYMYSCMYMYMYRFLYRCMCHTCAHACNVFIYIYISNMIHVYVCAHIHICIYTYILISIHAYMPNYLGICAPKRGGP